MEMALIYILMTGPFLLISCQGHLETIWNSSFPWKFSSCWLWGPAFLFDDIQVKSFLNLRYFWMRVRWGVATGLEWRESRVDSAVRALSYHFKALSLENYYTINSKRRFQMHWPQDKSGQNVPDCGGVYWKGDFIAKGWCFCCFNFWSNVLL